MKLAVSAAFQAGQTGGAGRPEPVAGLASYRSTAVRHWVLAGIPGFQLAGT
jgi:hypothetical protein